MLCIFLSKFFLIKFSKLNSYGLDVPANILLILSIFYFLQLIFCKKKNVDLFKILSVILIFSFSIRIGSALFLILLLYTFFKKKFYTNLIFTKFFLFTTLFLILWIIQQFLYTGCLVFPYEFLCFDKLIWADKDFILKFKEGTFLANKSYESYSGNLTYNEYFKNFNWVSTWFLRNKIELFEYIGLFFFIVIISFVISKKNLLIKIDEEKNSYLRILLITIFLSFLIWFLNSPSIRMGNHLFLSLIFFLIFFPPFFKKNLFIILSKKAITLILVLSFLVFSIKHYSRISKNIDNNLEPWPEFKKIAYYEERKSGLKINRVINGNSPQLTVCWDVKFLCLRSHLNNLKINKIYDYIVLSIDR